MRFEFTVAAPTGPRDIAITAADDATSVALRRAVAEAAALCGVVLPPERAPLPRTGAVLRAGGGPGEPPDTADTSVVVAAGRRAGTVRPLRPGRFVIGRAPDCDLVVDDASVSRRHVALDVGRRRVIVRDLDSTNGSRIDGAALDGDAEWRPGQLLELGNSAIGLHTGDDDVRLSPRECGDVLVVNRTPRPAPPSPADPIELPSDTTAPARQRMAVVAALVPAALGALIVVLTGSLQFLLFSALTPLMLISTALGDRVHWRRLRRRVAADRRRDLHAAGKAIERALSAERDQLRAGAPHAGELERIATTPASRLWERSLDDPDFLGVRLGTASLRSQVQTRCADVVCSAGTIPAAPVCVDLRAGPLGLCGPPEVVQAVARWLLVQLATLHSPAVARLALVLPGLDERWRWARWLPHVRLPAATDPESVDALAAELRRPAEGTPPTVVLVDATAARPGQLPDLGDLQQVIYLAREPEAVRARCTQVVTVDDPRVSSAVLARRGAEPDGPLTVVLDQVEEGYAERIARALAPLTDASSPAAVLEASPSLAELVGARVLDADCVANQWRRNGTTPRTPLGTGGDGAVWIDLRADGPHCLIAGTTGAGKSELLRTLVVGLALNCSPAAVNFVLIDYKGGAAFAACADLPHTAGLVTDLDEHGTTRALRSLHAELRRRERLLASAGVTDIGSVHRAQPDALPRLVVVVDEFAALAEELPGFVSGLVSVAQRGRSLGLHLVFATQRPGRAVTPEIKANTSVRIALRVTDVSESLDVIDVPDAAKISPDFPGTGFVRAGDHVTGFRAARVGPPQTQEVRVEPLGRWRQPLTSPDDADPEGQLRAVVATVADAAQRCGAERARRPWLPALPEHVADPGGTEGSAEVALGLLDLPDEQRQDTIRLDLAAARPVLTCGTAGSGRTSMLLGAALRATRQLSPAELEIYVIERNAALSAALAALPHVACTVSAAGDMRLVETLLRRLAAPPADPRAPGRAALRLLLVDDWDAVLAAGGDSAAARLTDLLTNLLRTAADCRLTVLVTGDRSLLAARWSSYVGARLLLRLADRIDYTLAGIVPRDVPAEMPPGRALRADDGAELQLFAPPQTHDEAHSQAVTLARRWAHVGASSSAIRIRRLPEHVALTGCAVPPAGLRLGVGGDGAGPVAIDPFSSGHLLVAGPPRSGRSTVLLTILAECRRTGMDVVVAAPRRSPLHARAAQFGLWVIDGDTSADGVGGPPTNAALVLVDDCEAFDDTAAGARLADWLRRRNQSLAAVVAGRTDELASAYRGLGAEARRNRSGLLLRPGPMDGELLGVRLERSHTASGPGRGVLVGVRAWAETDAETAHWRLLDAAEPTPVQIALPDPPDPQPAQPSAMWGYR